MTKGYVYVLSNECMPGIIKIGRTTRSVDQRAIELWQTGVPKPFKVEFSKLTVDCINVEHRAHAALQSSRLDQGREFFRAQVKDAIRVIEDMAREELDNLLWEIDESLSVTDRDAMVDPSEIRILADRMGETPEVVSLSFWLMTEDEYRPVINRFYEREIAREADRAEK